MAKNTFVEKEPSGYVRLKNTSGAEVVAGEFCIIGSMSAIAQETIAANAYGNFLTGPGALIQTDTLETGEDTFGTGNQFVFWNNSAKTFSDTTTTGYYKVGQLNTVKDSNGVIAFTKYERAEVVSAAIGDLETIVTAITAESGTPFRKTATLTAAAAGTAVNILTEADVGSKTAFIMGAILKVDGGTAWTDSSGTVVKVQDTNGSPVVGLTYAKAQLTANAILVLGTAGLTIGDAVSEGTGFTAAKGLDIIADSNFDAGSDIKITIFGYMA